MDGIIDVKNKDIKSNRWTDAGDVFLGFQMNI